MFTLYFELQNVTMNHLDFQNNASKARFSLQANTGVMREK